jgi:hypothetical protein
VRERVRGWDEQLHLCELFIITELSEVLLITTLKGKMSIRGFHENLLCVVCFVGSAVSHVAWCDECLL